MVKGLRRTCCALLALLGCDRDTKLPPAPKHWCTDRAKFLSEPVRLALDAQLQAYQERTSHHVLVWIDHAVPQRLSLEVYTLLLFNAWGVGRWKIDDGVVLFVFVDDHKLRILVGYGLDQKLTDRECSRVIREVIVPAIEAGTQDAAIVDGVTAILAAIGDQ